MITFKKYLELPEGKVLQPNVSVPWDATDIIPSQVNAEFILRHCSDWLNDLENGKLLYRGTSSTSSGIKLIDTTNSKRSSRDTNNLYQLIMDASQNMVDVPSRSNSIIVVTNHSTALAYANQSHLKTYLVLPFDGTKIACFKSVDIFDAAFKSEKLGVSEHVVSKKLSEFFMFVIGAVTLNKGVSVRELFNKADLAKIVFFWDLCFFNGSKLDFSELDYGIQADYKSGKLSYKLISAVLNKPPPESTIKLADKVFDYMQANNFATTSSELGEFIKLMKSGSSDYFQALSSEIAKTEEFGITLQNVGSLTIGKRSECWFSGKCLLIRFDYVSHVIEELEGKLGKSFSGFDYMRSYFNFIR